MQIQPSGKKAAILAAALLFGALACQPAMAQHRHFYGPRVGVYIGAPVVAYSYYRPYYYSPYYYPPAYYPPVVLAPPTPPTYVEQTPQYQPEAPQAAPQGAMWYYCTASRAYYPYVKTCPEGWQQVTPQPQG